MTTNVERCNLAHDLDISRVLTGLWQIADLERDGKTLDQVSTAKKMQPYVDAGFTTFDMADHYGSAEIIAGCFQKSSTQQVQLFTKWVPKPGGVTKDDVRIGIERALRRMQADRIDLMQFHSWNYGDPEWLDCLAWLEELKKEGLIHHLGLTNCDTAHLRIVLHSGFDVVSNQVCFSLIDRRAASGMSALCQEHNVKLLCYGTLAGGFLTEKWLDKPEPAIDSLATWSEMKYKRFIDAAGGWQALQGLLQAMKKVAARHEVSMANIACRYVLEQPAVGGIIIGARLGQNDHVADNKRLFEFSLDEESHSVLAEALEAFSPVPGDCGDEYRKPPFLTATGDLSHHIESLPAPYAARTTENGLLSVLSGTVWEKMAGFSRAVRHGDRICISGTTATHGERAIGGNDPAAQCHFAIDKIDGALQSLGARLEDVIRTRIFIRNVQDWEPVARAHGERFGHIQPANTLVQAELIGDEYLVEIEAEAVIKK